MSFILSHCPYFCVYISILTPNCPLREKCTRSKKCVKIVTRHIWEEYKEQANENRYTKLWKDNYPLRKETIERTFGDCKE